VTDLAKVYSGLQQVNRRKEEGWMEGRKEGRKEGRQK
jgi:predicted transposase YdaD